MPALVRLAWLVTAALAGAVALLRAWLALVSAADVNLVSGVWLALAADVREGIFYRPLAEAGYYGGTRYFPLLFLLIGGLMRLGMSPLAAGQVVAVLGGAVLTTGVAALLARLGLPRRLVVTGALLSSAPYFVIQTIAAIRAEPLAAGLICWGASFAAGRLGGRDVRGWAVRATICFMLGIAAKPTAGYAVLAACAALACAGRRRDALHLAWWNVVGGLALTAAMSVASQGRAWAAFHAGALGGGSIASAVAALMAGDAVRLVLVSHYLSAVAALVVVAAVAAPRDLLRLPGLLVIIATGTAAVILATPGTILTNQSVEPYVAAVVYLTWTTGRYARTGPAAYLILTALLLWTAARNGRDVQAHLSTDRSPAAVEASRAVLAGCRGTLLAESPLLPVLAGERAVLLDPFAFRVAALRHPELTDDLVSRLRARVFECVVLEMDPASPAGSGWYRNVHLGAPVIDALFEGYTLDRFVGGRLVYVPRMAGADRSRGG